MHLQGILCLQLIVASWATSIDVIHDYMLFKKITRVVGFSCGGYENDQQIIRAYNDAGILVSTETLGPNIDIQRSLRTDYWNLGVFVDLRCPVVDKDIVNIFDEASRYYMFGHLHQWLILGRNMEHTVRLLNDSTFSITTDFVISLPRDDGYILYDIYNHCKHCGGSLSITNFGTWDRETGLNVTLLESKFSRRRDFQRIKVKCAGVIVKRPVDQDLIEYLNERNAVLEDNWAKFGYSLLVNVAYMYNFSLETIELNHWPPNDENGPLMSGLRDQLFDLGYYPSLLTHERLDWCDVTLQVWPARTCFMFRTLPSQEVDMNIIFRPLEKKVWYMFCVLLLVMVLVLRIIFKSEKQSHYDETVFVIIGAMCQQGLPFEKNKLSSRVAFLQTFIFGILLYNCYSAAIVSSRLNSGQTNKMNDSLASLIRSGMKLGAYKNIFFNILLSSKTADVEYFREYWDTIPEEAKFQPLMEGIRGIMNSGFAYHADPVIVYPVIERMFTNDMISQLTEVHLLQRSALGLWSAPHGHFQEIVKIGLIRTYTAGIRSRELLRWSSRKPYYNKIKQEASSVTIIETMPILLLLIFGMVVSLVICILEHIVFRTTLVYANRKK
ncbi:ionotropic receptor 75a-like isoform X3 [Andrena cerasifolii]|uniref:ionotropic receptor 75a-like isoform X3 n=1 Tax=Andrena cerasifolii TaxID=2819439 RepID=UPI004037BD7E